MSLLFMKERTDSSYNVLLAKNTEKYCLGQHSYEAPVLLFPAHINSLEKVIGAPW